MENIVLELDLNENQMQQLKMSLIRYEIQYELQSDNDMQGLIEQVYKEDKERE